MPTYLPTVASINYAPADVPVHANRSARLYLPVGVPQDYGYKDGRWPIIICCNLDGFTTSTPQQSYVSNEAYIGNVGTKLYGVDRFLDAGRAVFDITVCRLNFTYAASPPSYGLGLFHPRGAASGRMEDNNYPMCWKDGMYAVAYLKKNADDIDGAGSKIQELPGWYARSSGTAVGQFAHFAGGLLGNLGSTATDTMYGYSTNIAFIAGQNVIGLHALWFASTASGAQFPSMAQHPNYGAANTANELIAPTQATVHASYRAAFTNLGALFEPAHRALPFVAAYGGSVTFDSTPNTFDVVHYATVTNSEGQGHSAYAGMVRRYLYPDKTQIFIAQDQATADTAGDGMFTRQFSTPKPMYDAVIQLILDMTKPAG